MDMQSAYFEQDEEDERAAARGLLVAIYLSALFWLVLGIGLLVALR